MPLKPLDAKERQVIHEHLDNLLDGVNRSVSEFRTLARSGNNAHIRGQLVYWEHVAAAFEWAKRIADQRTTR